MGGGAVEGEEGEVKERGAGRMLVGAVYITAANRKRIVMNWTLHSKFGPQLSPEPRCYPPSPPPPPPPVHHPHPNAHHHPRHRVARAPALRRGTKAGAALAAACVHNGPM